MIKKNRFPKKRRNRMVLLFLLAAALFFTQADGLSALAYTEPGSVGRAGLFYGIGTNGAVLTFTAGSETDDSGENEDSDENDDSGESDGDDEDGGSGGVCEHADTEIQGAVEATCQSVGYTGNLVCLDCGEILEYGEEIPALDHIWDEGTVTREADCETEGAITYSCTRCGAVMIEAVAALGHDYTFVEFVAPTSDDDGYVLYECTRCGDYKYQWFAPTTIDDMEITYGDISEAMSDSLTVYVGYFGMDYVQKTVLTLDEILSNCVVLTYTYSYIDKSYHVVYDVAAGPAFIDVLDLAGIDTGSVDFFRFRTYDSGLNYFGGEYTYSLIFQRRYYYPLIGQYYMGESGFSDITEAKSEREVVEPILAIWDSWLRYGYGDGFDASNHTNLSALSCFRLMYGQTDISEIDATSSAKYINTIYVQYEGSPEIDAGDDLNLTVSSDYTVTANISTVDESLTEAFQNAAAWSSSDESVVKIDASTGQITVVGEGTATITVTSEVNGLTITDSLTVTVTEGDEDLSGGGGGDDETDEGSGTGGGEGSGTGGGEGSGTGDGEGSGTGGGEGSGTGGGEGSGTDEDEGSGTGEDEGTDEGESDEGESDNGGTDGGESDEGESDNGGTDGGESDEGESDNGGTDDSESDNGESDDGESDDNKSDGETGNTDSDSSDSEDPADADDSADEDTHNNAEESISAVTSEGQLINLVRVQLADVSEILTAYEDTDAVEETTDEMAEETDKETDDEIVGETDEETTNETEEETDGETADETGLLVRAAYVGGGGGASGNEQAVLLTLTEDVNLLMVVLFTAICFAAGCVIMLFKYKKEI